MKRRVVVAMSGGVDSSVAAAILSEQGYDVVGVAMRLADGGDGPSYRARRGACCSYEDFEDARRVAERLGFPFYVVDMREEFENRVIGNFVSEYLAGRTPNPCVMCNREIKFDRLWERARALDADFIATGHYARIERCPCGEYRLMRAEDSSKDQSYFLFSMNQSQLSRTLFPLGAMTKADVRHRARLLELVNADKAESQEICFVADNDYAGFVERAAGDAIRTGNVVGSNGAVLSRHNGIHRFTVGQRRGLGIAAGEPLYVREIRPGTGDVVVAPSSELRSRGLVAREVSMVRDPASDSIAIEARIRYRHPDIPATLRMGSDRRAEVIFDNGGPAVTPGQACVFYNGNEVLGGGFIESAL
ncbi:MAG TPA: tRNA 2-thiouridine(34) synthase MnmA [Candidatus Binataceae bacterium]|nr:tRNA 2-thiouridine(34) synthase MnmA [Candidatus Binataceae bacterium]